MFDFNNMVTKVTQPSKQQLYVGAPGEGKALTVHPTDQTEADTRVNLYYDLDTKRMHIFDITQFPDIESLYKKKLNRLTRSVLHRAHLVIHNSSKPVN